MITEKTFCVYVKPNSKTTAFLGFDSEKRAYVVSVAAPAEKNKANIELVKFLSKLIGRRVRIRRGMNSRLKFVEVV